VTTRVFNEAWFAAQMNGVPETLLGRFWEPEDPRRRGGLAAQVFWAARVREQVQRDGEGARRLKKLRRSFRKLKEEALPAWYFRKLQVAIPRYALLAGELFMDLDRGVEEVAAFEWLMQAHPGKFYRDHLLHQLKVGHVAQWLLDLERDGGTYREPAPGLPEERRTLGWEAAEVYAGTGARAAETRTGCWRLHARLLGVPAERVGTPGFWYRVLLRATWLAALCHDVGVPVQFLRDRFLQLAGTRCLEGRFSADDLRRALVALGNRPVLFPFNGYTAVRGPGDTEQTWRREGDLIRETYEETHSFASALHLLLYLEEVRGAGRLDPEVRLVFDLAALAVLQHDLEHVYWREVTKGTKDRPGTFVLADGLPPGMAEGVSWLRHPVGYVLMLADQVQDFGRAHLVAEAEAKANDGKLKRPYWFADPCPEVQVTVGKARTGGGRPGLTVTCRFVEELGDEAKLPELQRKRYFPERRVKVFSGDRGAGRPLLRDGPFQPIRVLAKGLRKTRKRGRTSPASPRGRS